MDLIGKISKAELEVMKILWSEKKPVSFTDIRVRLSSSKGWNKSTINTLIRRLSEKGAINSRKLDKLYYTSNISEEEYVRTEEQDLLDKLYDGSAKNFVAALYRRGTLSKEDIDELREYFRMEVTKCEDTDME